MKIERHRTAIQRNQLSRPVLVTLRDGLLSADRSFFDYGCGRGQDLEYLREMGIQASGWDPAHAPDEPKKNADVVNLGYVINVVEDPNERKQALLDAFSLCKGLLVVSAMVGFKERALRNSRSHNDGVVTQRGTFQRYFEQAELGDYISSALKRDAYPAAQGVFYVFASENLERDYCNALANEESTPESSEKVGAIRVEESDLKEISAEVFRLRRLPLPSELPKQGVVLGLLASSDDWLQHLSNVLTQPERDGIRQERRAETLRAIALSFYSPEGGARMSDLTLTQRADVRMVFGSMARAQTEVERDLKRLLNPARLERECRDWKLGKLTPSALYLHVSLESELPEQLKLLLDCAQFLAGDQLNGSENILKLNFKKPGVSFAQYPDFDAEPHPSLRRAVRADFASSSVAVRDYGQSKSPPILHRKELFVSPEHESFESWLAFTREEESLGLLGRRDIGTFGGWCRLLASKGIKIDGCKLIQGEPYELEIETDEAVDADEDFEVSLQSSKRKRSSAGRTRAPRWSEEDLNLLAQVALRLGRAPLPAEVKPDEKSVKRFSRNDDWEALLGERFDQHAFERRQRERWKHWVVYLAATRFGVTGRPKLKQLDDSARADIKAFFQSYRLACAEADHWLMKIGKPEEITNAISTYPFGMHHPEKGLYLHKSLFDDLPVVLQLLMMCGKFMAGRSMFREVTVARIALDGRNVKFYEYKDFDKPGPATRLQSVKVDFHRRKVIPRDYFHPPKVIWERAGMMGAGCSGVEELREFEEELRRKLIESRLESNR